MINHGNANVIHQSSLAVPNPPTPLPLPQALVGHFSILSVQGIRHLLSFILPHCCLLSMISLLTTCKASDTLGDFIRRSPQSAKIARCARCSDCDYRRSPRSAYKIADIRHVRYRQLNSPAFAKCTRYRNFYIYSCESTVKPTHQVGRFYHMSFQNCHIAVIGEKKSPGVSASIGGDQIHRSAYKIARCVAGLRISEMVE